VFGCVRLEIFSAYEIERRACGARSHRRRRCHGERPQRVENSHSQWVAIDPKRTVSKLEVFALASVALVNIRRRARRSIFKAL